MNNFRNWIQNEAVIGRIEASCKAAIANPRIRKTIVSVAAAFLILQLYFIRELLAVELLFGLVFAFWLLLATVIYIVGTIGEHGLEWGDRGVRFIVQAAKRSYAFATELAKKSQRHPESAR
jgi:hypothetical protein